MKFLRFTRQGALANRRDVNHGSTPLRRDDVIRPFKSSIEYYIILSIIFALIISSSKGGEALVIMDVMDTSSNSAEGLANNQDLDYDLTDQLEEENTIIVISMIVLFTSVCLGTVYMMEITSIAPIDL